MNISSVVGGLVMWVVIGILLGGIMFPEVIRLLPNSFLATNDFFIMLPMEVRGVIYLLLMGLILSFGISIIRNN